MKQKFNWKEFALRSLSYVLVAMAASVISLALWGNPPSKLAELEQLLDSKFIGEADMNKVQDAAANAMVNALGDRWSYYISAEDYASYQENKDNAYVGIGITVVAREDGQGFGIEEVNPGGAAQQAGILPGDVIVKVDGQDVRGKTLDDVSVLIRGEEGTPVTVTVLRDGEEKTFSVNRQTIRVPAAKGEILPGNIGLVRINNFNANCAQETIAIVKDLMEQGAVKLIFDVRNNPGGYVHEMVKVLDYLLPEGVVYQDMSYLGIKSSQKSDAACVKLPMAVLVNGNSYSAAEFFAAVLNEYDWATVVGQQTCGKGYYQTTQMLSDGSAVNLSTGKYFTPKGVNLTEIGGLTPDIPVEVDGETASLIYAQLLPVEKDPQIQAAIQALQENNG